MYSPPPLLPPLLPPCAFLHLSLHLHLLLLLHYQPPQEASPLTTHQSYPGTSSSWLGGDSSSSSSGSSSSSSRVAPLGSSRGKRSLKDRDEGRCESNISINISIHVKKK